MVSDQNVVTLKNTVPTSCTPQHHQSIRRGSHANTRIEASASEPGPRSALTDSSHWSAAAEVNSTEPTKKTVPSVCGPTRSRKGGSGATRKHREPPMNSTAIHQEARWGAQTTLPRPGRVRDRRDACLRCAREDHSTVRPSGCVKVTDVVKGPVDLLVATFHPVGACGYPLTPLSQEPTG